MVVATHYDSFNACGIKRLIKGVGVYQVFRRWEEHSNLFLIAPLQSLCG